MIDIKLRALGERHNRRPAAIVMTSVAAVVVAGLSAAPAQSASSSECPEPYPVGSLAPGQAVTGLTVSRGTDPDEFTGEVIGVLDEGIAPGLDMIMVRLESPEIDRVGIWAGMSGSPVYAEDGRLIGAVSYGLAFGTSPVAGVTPAADMQDLLDGRARTRVRTARRVELPPRLQDRVDDAPGVSRAEAEGGLKQLQLPFAIAGVSQQRFGELVDRLDLDGVRAIRVGKAAGTDADDIRAGGNIGAAVSYGDVSFAGIGTVTAVCGSDVSAFGHPMLWTGPSSLSLHSADALYVQEDAYVGFKVANLGEPVGTIGQDRLAGIAGSIGTTPKAGDVTSTTRSGTRERTGTSRVNLPDWMPDVAFTHVLTNADRVFDGIGKGSGQMSWVVRGTREDGTPFEVRRADVHASGQDLTYPMVSELYEALWELEFNGTEDLTIDSVTTDSSLSRDYEHAEIESVSVRHQGRWLPLDKMRRLDLRAGHTAKFRVELDVVGQAPSAVVVKLPVKRRHLGQRASLVIAGGNSMGSDFFGSKSVDKLIEKLQKAPQNDEVIARLHLGRRRGVATEASESTGVVVDGGTRLRVRIVR